MNLGSLLLSRKAFAFQALWFLGGWGSGQAEGHLDGVVNEPLQGSQGTNHDDTGSKALP